VPQDQPPWAEQADLLDLVQSTHRVLDEVGSAGFAAFVVTPEECRLDLYWVGPPPRAVVEVIGHDRRVVVHDGAAHDHDRLSRAAEARALARHWFAPPGSRSSACRSSPKALGWRSGSRPAGPRSTCRRPRLG
jgi:hypothetical protein